MLHDEVLNVSDAHQISHKSSKPWRCFIWQLKTRCLKQDKSYSTGPTFQSHWQKGRNYTTGMYFGLFDVNNLILKYFCKFMRFLEIHVTIFVNRSCGNAFNQLKIHLRSFLHTTIFTIVVAKGLWINNGAEIIYHPKVTMIHELN